MTDARVIVSEQLVHAKSAVEFGEAPATARTCSPANTFGTRRIQLSLPSVSSAPRMRFSEAPVWRGKAGPRLGEDTASVRAGLGFTPAETADPLRRAVVKALATEKAVR